jgi:hypothetical protein
MSHIFLFNFGLVSKYIYPYKVQLIKSYFFLISNLKQNNFNIFIIYYLLYFILTISFTNVHLKEFQNLLIIHIQYLRYQILPILNKLIYYYIPMLDNIKLVSKFLFSKYLGVISVSNFNLYFDYDLDIFFDLGIVYYEQTPIKYSINFLMKFYSTADYKLYAFYYLQFFKLPVLIS